MGIAILATARLMQAVPVWVEGWKPLVAGARTHRSLDAAAWPGMAKLTERLLARLAPRHRAARASLKPHAAGKAIHPRPLRVLRVLEPQLPSAAAGRMVISGRMADVCAELDRLAAAEVARRQ